MSRAHDRLKLPPAQWLSWPGLALHALVGTAYTALFALLGSPPVTIVVGAVILGLVHEQAERTPDGRYWCDFRLDCGGPWNGALDVVAFLPAPVIWWALS